MRFSSLPFLFGFLPITLAIYFAVPLRWRNLALLLASRGVTAGCSASDCYAPNCAFQASSISVWCSPEAIIAT